MKLYTPTYDCHQPPCINTNEALMELDSIIYTLINGEMTINERTDAISKFIRSSETLK